jgi:signal transduction histidine kinase
MVEGQLSELLYRTILTYFAQGVIGLLLFLVFLHFYSLNKHKFLQTWAFSWFAFFLFMISTSSILMLPKNGYTEHRFWLSLASMTFSFWQVAFILIGCFVLVRKQDVKPKRLWWILGSILLISLTIILYKHENPDAGNIRYLLRVGIKYLLIGIGFLIAGLITLKNPQFTRGIGQKILASGFLSYGLVAIYYSTIVILNFLGGTHAFPSFFGLLELIVIFLIGLGMIMWMLEDEREKLKKTNQELDSFLYSVSHDLRAPIASILGLTNLAKIEAEPNEINRKYFDMIDQRVKKLDIVIGDILRLSRSKNSEAKHEFIDFNKLVFEIIADLKFNEGASAIRLNYVQNPENTFYSDTAQLKIIVGNLLSNAVKYHRLDQADPYIEVIFSKSKSKTIFSIRDNGEGIPKDNHDRIFNMFFRASTQSDGTGLGLYIVKEALAKIDGEITLLSEEGKGSLFTVTLINDRQ